MMDAPSFLQLAWFVLVGLLLGAYSVLDGLDLGVGMLLPFLARTPRDRKELFQAIGPIWDGNEVWLITGAGALFAAFPEAYATVFSGLYLALMLILFSLILRAASVEFRSHARQGQRLWDAVFVGASFLPSLLFGIALGNIVAGLPLDARMEYTGSFFTLFRPLPLAFGLLGLAAIALQGSAWAALKGSTGLQKRAREVSLALVNAFGALFLAALIVGALTLPSALRRPAAWGAAVWVAAAIGLLHGAVRKARDGLALALTSSFLGLWAMVGFVQYPRLVRASVPELSLTAVNASSSPLTLKVMLIIALAGMPLVAGYTLYVYRLFKGKSGAGDTEY
jgi:cytochrome d ubiquinol oxidase subunit II